METEKTLNCHKWYKMFHRPWSGSDREADEVGELGTSNEGTWKINFVTCIRTPKNHRILFESLVNIQEQ